jgi:hypothetical protein
VVKFTIGLLVGLALAHVNIPRIVGYLFSRGDGTLTVGQPKFRTWIEGEER